MTNPTDTTILLTDKVTVIIVTDKPTAIITLDSTPTLTVN